MHFSRVAVLAAIFSATLFAQEFRSTISGVVTDPSGAPIGGAKVVATETRTGVKTPTVSDAAGKYTMPFLAPGQYESPRKLRDSRKPNAPTWRWARMSAR